MANTEKNRKIINRLVLLCLITTPLFAILGGTPFFRFDFRELSNFLPGIYFTAAITILFWIINISLLLLAEKYSGLKNIFVRATVSIILGTAISTTGFYSFVSKNPPQNVRFSTEGAGFGGGQMFVRSINTGPVTDTGLRIFGPAGVRPGRPRFFFFPMALRSLTINLIILTLCELVFLHYRKQKIEDENIYLRQMNLEARNNQLKMQLHPHFLFNSLNTLRLLLKKDTGKAEDYLLKLSDILRFSTTSALQNVVNIEDELNLCISYLQMQKVRFGDMLYFVVTNPALYKVSGSLPVYSLQLLAENAIKHNALTYEQPLTVYIDYDEAKKEITVRNRIQPRRTMEATTRTGLKNLDERYKLLNHEGIHISADHEEFAVTVAVL